MAKVTAPLFGFSASGKIADSLVFMKWKGIATVRKYLIPANPKSAAQTTQRNRLAAAVLAWHTVALTALDQVAWNVLATLAAKPLSGFNKFVKEFLRIDIAGDTWELLTVGSAVPGSAGELDVQIDSDDAATVVVAKYGTKKTLLLTEINLSETTGTWSVTITGLDAGVKYYVQFIQVTSGIEGISGIYEGVAG